MNLLLIGVGGVGQSVAAIIKRAGKNGRWMKKIVLADDDLDRAQKAEAVLGDPRFIADKIDANDSESIKAVAQKHGIDFILAAVDPVFNQTIFDTAFDIGVGYMDCAMTLSYRHPERPYEECGIKLGDYQFARDDAWREKGLIACCGSGSEPGMTDVFAKYASKHLFDEINELNVRTGDNYTGAGEFLFSVWSTIEQCLNPPVIWEKEKGWHTTENFSEPEIFDFPSGIGPVEVVNIEHEEVLLMPRYIDCKRATFKSGISRKMRAMLKDLETLGMGNAADKIKIGDQEIAPRDFLVKVIPSPIESTKLMEGKGCSGLWVTGKKDGKERSIYLYQIVDCQECREKFGTNPVVSQMAMGPVIMLDLIANGIWTTPGVNGPEAFDPDEFIKRMDMYGFPPGLQERPSEYSAMLDNEAMMRAVR